MVEKALSPLRRKDVETGRKLEREAIVAWLRGQGIAEDERQSEHGWWDTSTGALYGASILEAIEQGKHLNA